MIEPIFRRGRILALVIAFLLLAAPRARPDDTILPLSAFPKAQLAIRTAAGQVHSFTIWLAQDRVRQEQGLMYIRHMDAHEGMLFIYPGEQKISMWMKNTLIPLDMLFIAADGRVVHVAKNAVPESLDTISAPRAISAVLEISGGLAESLGIHEGDRVSSRALTPPSAPK